MKINILIFIIFFDELYCQVTFPDSSDYLVNSPSTNGATATTKVATTSAATQSATTPTTATTRTATTPTTTRAGSTASVFVSSTLRGTMNTCVCIPDKSCNYSLGGNLSLHDGSGQIFPRIVNPSRLPNATYGTNEQVTSPASTGLYVQSASPTNCSLDALELCCPRENGFRCGVSYPPVNGAVFQQGRATFGQFPWQGILFTLEQSYVGSGVLIDQFHFLTVAHRLDRFPNGKFKVRMGEWDTSNRNEPIPYMEFNVTRVFVHPNYTSINLFNNVALMRLSPAVPLGSSPTISTACLPAKPILAPMRCWLSGWGRNDFYFGSNQPIQRCVDLPLVDFEQCQNTLRQTKLGRHFNLDPTSFMCAGGEAGKDACTGDGGAPLVCHVRGQWFVAGLVAWGVNCAQSIPGVYMNVTNYIPWIQSQTRVA